MNMTPSASTFLLQFFQEFYREVLIQRELAYHSVETIGSSKSPLDEKEEEGSDSEQLKQEEKLVEEEELCDKIQRVFKILFERFSLTAQNQAGEFATAHFQEALYAMVALLDEVFLAFSWTGKERWENNLMEKQFFHTQVAGELLFRKIETLIQVNDPMQRDLAIIYLMTLALGFKGKYRGEEDEGRMNWYRHQLYSMAYHKSVSLFYPGQEHLVEDCYNHVVTMPPTKILPNVRNWILAFVGVIAIYVTVSAFLWYKLVRDMDNAVGQILTQAQKLGLS
jgi:type VI secretion system protein ImpK